MAKSETGVPEADTKASPEPGAESGLRAGQGPIGMETVSGVIHAADVLCPKCGHSVIAAGANDRADVEPNGEPKPEPSIGYWEAVAGEWHRLYYAWTRIILANGVFSADFQQAAAAGETCPQEAQASRR